MKPYLTRHWLVLVAIVLFFAASNLVWWGMDLVPPMWDQADYLLHAQNSYHALTERGIAAFYASFLKGLTYKAPLLTILPAPLYLIFGNSYKTALLVNLAFMIAGSYFLYRLGELLLGRTEGILAVLILHTFPIVFAMSREFLVEYGLMVLVIAWYYFLLRSDSFQDRRVSYALGIVLGLGLLMKISFPLYVIVPTLFVLVTLFKGKRKFPAELFKNSAIIVGLAAVIAAPWYLRNLKSVIDFAIISGYSERAREYGTGAVFSLNTILSYWLLLINYGITTYWFVMFLLASVFGLVICRRAGGNTLQRPHLWVLVLWFMVPFIVYTFGINKDYRYAAPMLPVVALALGAGAGRLLKLRYAKIPAYVLLALSLFNFAYISFLGSMICLKAGPFIVLHSWLAYARPPLREQWPLDRIVSSIDQDAARNGLEGTAATLLFNHEYLNFINLAYYGAMQKAQVRFNTNDHYTAETVDQALDRISKESGYLMTKSDQTGPDLTNVKNKVIAGRLAGGELPFQRFADIELPDKTTLTLYRKTIRPPGGRDGSR
jgi:4-amino-4-deoxy-L-arabinose transferase-like glycosyltransferase